MAITELDDQGIAVPNDAQNSGGASSSKDDPRDHDSSGAAMKAPALPMVSTEVPAKCSNGGSDCACVTDGQLVPAEEESGEHDQSFIMGAKNDEVSIPGFDPSLTPWERRYGVGNTPRAKPIPFGAGVFYVPAPTKTTRPKVGARMHYGVFLGYETEPGGRWNHKYVVAALEDFVGRELNEHSSRSNFPHFTPHFTSVVSLPSSGDIVFPLKARYNQANLTLDGLENKHPFSLADADVPEEVNEVHEPGGGEDAVDAIPDTHVDLGDGFTMQPRKDGKLRMHGPDGFEYRAESTRPLGVHPDLWRSLSRGQQDELKRTWTGQESYHSMQEMVKKKLGEKRLAKIGHKDRSSSNTAMKAPALPAVSTEVPAPCSKGGSDCAHAMHAGIRGLSRDDVDLHSHTLCSATEANDSEDLELEYITSSEDELVDGFVAPFWELPDTDDINEVNVVESAAETMQNSWELLTERIQHAVADGVNAIGGFESHQDGKMAPCKNSVEKSASDEADSNAVNCFCTSTPPISNDEAEVVTLSKGERKVLKNRRRHEKRRKLAAGIPLEELFGDGNPDTFPAMPCWSKSGAQQPHRERMGPKPFPANLAVARPVSRKEVRSNPKAQAAMDDEWSKLEKAGVWDLQVRCWYEVAAEARRLGKKVHIGALFDICTEKNSELDPKNKLRKFKGRVVFQGNRVYDEAHEIALFADLGSSPSTMEASRVADFIGCTPGYDEQLADAEQAYVQAPLGPDTIPVWATLPYERLPKSGQEMVDKGIIKKPVVLLRKALYGHPDSGTIWETHCDRHLLAAGFESLNDKGWPGTYFHRQLSLFLVVYVDDFKMSGPSQNLEKGWALITSPTSTTPGLVIGDVTPAHNSRYLGCKHRREAKRLKDGRTVMTMSYDMTDFLKSCVSTYTALALEQGFARPLSPNCTTPFLAEDSHEALQSKPCHSGRAYTCTWCGASFPTGEPTLEQPPTKGPVKKQVEGKAAGEGVAGAHFGGEFKDETGGLQSSGSPEPLKKDQAALTEGYLQPIATRVLMKLLYAARYCRFDLLRATCALAQRITKWTPHCDAMLHRLMSYVSCSLDLELVGWAGDNLCDVLPHLYAVGDLAGCLVTGRSTAGIYQSIRGPNTCFPISAMSKRHGNISTSTPESELTSGNMALRLVGLPSLDLWDVVLNNGCASTQPKRTTRVKMVFHEDNSAFIQVVRTGRNQTMRHLNRHHRISVAFLHETFKGEDWDLIYTPSAEMCADIFTKAFNDPLKWKVARMLINIASQMELTELLAPCTGESCSSDISVAKAAPAASTEVTAIVNKEFPLRLHRRRRKNRVVCSNKDDIDYPEDIGGRDWNKEWFDTIPTNMKAPTLPMVSTEVSAQCSNGVPDCDVIGGVRKIHKENEVHRRMSIFTLVKSIFKFRLSKISLKTADNVTRRSTFTKDLPLSWLRSGGITAPTDISLAAHAGLPLGRESLSRRRMQRSPNICPSMRVSPMLSAYGGYAIIVILVMVLSAAPLESSHVRAGPEYMQLLLSQSRGAVMLVASSGTMFLESLDGMRSSPALQR